MIRLQPNRTYRGPGGPDLKKDQFERQQELNHLLSHGGRDGFEIIVSLWKEAEGIPSGNVGPIGTMAKAEMIPAILAHEYPTASEA